jgi:hypothetical protein
MHELKPGGEEKKKEIQEAIDDKAINSGLGTPNARFHDACAFMYSRPGTIAITSGPSESTTY